MHLLKEDMPREKLLKFGIDVLTDYELIALVLGSGNKNQNVIDISKTLISKFGISELSKISIGRLKKEFGIGNAKACQLCSCFEISRRISSSSSKNRTKINCSKDVFDLLSPKLKDLNQESLFCVFLNTRKVLISYKKIFLGSLTELLINPREIFKFAIEENASAIILAHNHPSGECTPSKADIESTNEIVKAGKIMEIDVLDHIIIGQNEYWSLRENGFIE